MVISMDGRYLLVVCGIPEECIRVYNLEKRERVRGRYDFVRLRNQENIQLLDGKM